MTSRDFCYWLQGYLELTESLSLDQTKLRKVKVHLSMVFKHEIDPSFGDRLKELQKIHNKDSDLKLKPNVYKEIPITC